MLLFYGRAKVRDDDACNAGLYWSRDIYSYKSMSGYVEFCNEPLVCRAHYEVSWPGLAAKHAVPLRNIGKRYQLMYVPEWIFL